MAKQKLGSGLTELLGEVEKAYENDLNNQAGLVCEIEIDSIAPNPMQPRKVFEPHSLQELSDSIKEYGLLQPILLYLDEDNKYIIIAGERRWRASKMAGLTSIKAIILDDAKLEHLREIALIENIQREDLNPVELAQCYRELIEEYHLTHEELAQKISKSRTQITNTLRILNLEKNILDAILDNKISQGHAKILVGLESNERQYIASLIVEQSLSVRDTEELIRNFKKNKKSNQEDSSLNAHYHHETQDIKDEMQNLMELLKAKGIQSSVNKNKLQLIFENKESVTYFIKLIQ